MTAAQHRSPKCRRGAILACWLGFVALGCSPDAQVAPPTAGQVQSDAGAATTPRGADSGAAVEPDTAPSPPACLTQPSACDDGDACTDDSCDPAAGCTSLPRAATCADAVACTVDTCEPAQGCVHVPVAGACDDGNVCTADACDAATGCVHLPAPATCDVDGDGCTLDACAHGSCAAGTAKDCNDQNPCTADACAAGTCGHVALPDDAVCKAGQVADLVLIPAGKSAAGCPSKVEPVLPDGSFYLDKYSCTDANLPMRLFYVSAFRIQRHEATVAQYAACVQAGGCSLPYPPAAIKSTPKCEDCNWGVPGREQHPITCIDRDQAIAFCTWLGGRLPTDAEFDKALRGGCEFYPGPDCLNDAPLTPWGINTYAKPGITAVVGGEVGPNGTLVKDCPDGPACQKDSTLVKKGCAGALTCPVGSTPASASPYGLQDIYGNAFEYTNGWIKKVPGLGKYVGLADWPEVDPPGEATGVYPVVRGPFTAYELYASRDPAASCGSSAGADLGVRCRLPAQK